MTWRFELDEAALSERVDRAVVALLPELTRATVQRWIREGLVRINGRPCRPRDRVGPGDVLDVQAGARPVSTAAPDPTVRFDVVYEDDALIVVDKPAGLVVHPGRGHRTGTLVNGLLARPGFGVPPADPGDPEGYLRPGIVHRIDRDTSGLLVVAKTESARECLKAQLKAHSVERAYLALTAGVPRAGRIETLHGRHAKSRLRFTSFTERGRTAVTTVEVLDRLSGGAAALVRCRLETGRTHQIRVHLAERCRTPILGDRLYAGGVHPGALESVAAELGRQALHAALLGFEHPSGQRCRFESPLPPDLTRALERLRA